MFFKRLVRLKINIYIRDNLTFAGISAANSPELKILISPILGYNYFLIQFLCMA